jgi:hypothetical protein
MLKSPRLLLISVAASAIVGCMLAPEVRAQTADPATVKALIVRARQRFDERLNDYPSARFKDVRVMTDSPTGQLSLCGQVNARNQLGGYAGWQTFHFAIDPRFANDSLMMIPGDDSPCFGITVVPTDFSDQLKASS